MKLIWCKQRKTWVEPQDRLPGPTVHIQSDIEAIESPITGEVIHSRRQYEAHLKHFGYHVAEPGDVAKKAAPDRAGIRAAIKESIRELGV